MLRPSEEEMWTNGGCDRSMVSMNGTIRDLKNLELCYSPVFGTARDVVNQAALVAENILYGRFRQVPVTQVRSLVEEQAFIVDVREKGEYEVGHLKGSVNIPLSELRKRFIETLNLAPEDVIFPKNSQIFVAQGAGFLSEENNNTYSLEELQKKILKIK